MNKVKYMYNLTVYFSAKFAIQIIMGKYDLKMLD